MREIREREAIRRGGFFHARNRANSKFAVAKSTGAGQLTLLARAQLLHERRVGMAEKTRAELAAEAEDLGIEFPKKATKAQLEKLIEVKKAEESALGGEAADSGNEPVVMKGDCGMHPALNVRVAPSLDARVVEELEYGDKVEVESIEDGWAKIDCGYCMAKYLV